VSSEFDIGDRPRVRVQFVDLSGLAGDPAQVDIRARNPTATTLATLTATRIATGVYDAFIDLTSPGDWGVRAVGTGGLQAAAEAVFTVRRSEVL
jgi:hypothetical protein